MNFSKHPNAKGNIILGSEQTTSFAKNHSYCSLHNLNPIAEHVELDVSKVIGNTIATKGSIMMFYGNSVPPGWVLCNGSHGTPNLVDMFIEATTVSSKQKTTGGNHSISGVTNHGHVVSFEAGGKHTHTVNPDDVTSGIIADHTHADIREKKAVKLAAKSTCQYWTDLVYPHDPPPAPTCNQCLSYDGWNDFMNFHCEHKKGYKDPDALDTRAKTEEVNEAPDHTHTVNTGSHSVKPEDMGTHTVTLSSSGGTGKLNMPTYYSLVYIQKT